MPAVNPDIVLGENSRIFFGDTNIAYITGSVRETPQEIDTGTNLNGGFTTRKRGRRNLEASVTIFWTIAENPLANPPQIEPGSDFYEVRIFPDFVNAPAQFYRLPIAYFGDGSLEMNGVSELRYTGSIKNQGDYFSPSRPG